MQLYFCHPSLDLLLNSNIIFNMTNYDKNGARKVRTISTNLIGSENNFWKLPPRFLFYVSKKDQSKFEKLLTILR